MVPWGNLAVYAAASLAPTAVFWAALNASRLVRGLRDRRARPPAAAGPPIERLAADLRRVRLLLARLPPGTPHARRAGARQAYDVLLAQACAAVEVPHRLAQLPEGVDREVERLRVEDCLRRAGLAIP